MEIVSMYEKSFFDTLSLLVSSGVIQLVSVLVAITAFFYQYYREKNNKKNEFRDRLNRISNLLLLDLDKLEESRRTGHASVNFVLTREGGYYEDHISTEHYQSIVYSGLITYFEKETQFEVTHFYHLITLHNKRIFDMANMVNNVLKSAKFGDQDRQDLEASIAWKLNQEQLAYYEMEIRDRIPKIRKLLHNELKRLK